MYPTLKNISKVYWVWLCQYGMKYDKSFFNQKFVFRIGTTFVLSLCVGYTIARQPYIYFIIPNEIVINTDTVILPHRDEEFPTFWPAKDETMECGHFNVTLTEETHHLGYVTRDFILQSTQVNGMFRHGNSVISQILF